MDIDQALMRGSFYLTEAVCFHYPSHTAIFADLIQNFRRDWFKRWRGLVARLGGIVAPNPSAPHDLRMSFLNRRAARASLQRILAWPIEQVFDGSRRTGDLRRSGLRACCLQMAARITVLMRASRW